MKKLLFIPILLAALSFGAFGSVPHAYAQANCDSLSGQAALDCYASGANANANQYDSSAATQSALQNAGASSAEAQAAAQTAAQNSPTDLDTNSVGEGLSGVLAWVAKLFAWLLGAAIVTFDYSVYFTVVIMGHYVHNLTAVGVTWRILRDIGNIVLIFGFLAIGISIILDIEKMGYGRKLLPMLLVTAVFMNFSLFFAEAIIDVGNLFATQFVTQINGGQAPTADYLNKVNIGTEGISNKIMAQVGLANIYNRGQLNPAVFQANNQWLISFMSIILFIIAAFVFFALAFILIARFIYLIFLIILAPVGFAGLAIPQLSSYATKWWHNLFSQTITAPVLMLLLYVALAVITDASFLTGICNSVTCTADATGYVSGNIQGFASMLLTFLIAMGLLLFVVVAAKGLGAVGATGATKLAGSLSFGLTGWAANRTIGRGAYFAARRLRQSPGFNKFDALTGRAVTRTLDRTATGSFDIRGTGLLKKLPGGGIEAGEVAKDGFAGARKRTIEDAEKAAKSIETAYKEAPARTRAEERAVFDATKRATDLKTSKEDAEKEKVAAETELNRLKEEKAKDRYWETDPANVRKMEEAERKLTAATEHSAKAAEALKQADEAKAKAEKAPGDRVKKGITESKTAYAEGIAQPLNPINWVAYGPGTGAAAAKIKASLKEKSDQDKLTELLKKMNKEGEGAKPEAGKEGKAEEGKKAGDHH